MTDLRRTTRRYLLGELTEAEQQAFEQAFFDDPQRFEDVASEETALVDDYVRGRLTPEVRQRFESTYLSRPERRGRVAFAEALLARADAPATVTEDDGRRAERASRFSSWLGFPGLTLAAGVAAVVLALALWTTWQPERIDPGQQAQTNASPSTPAVAPPPTPPAVVTLALMVGAGERSSGAGRLTTLEIPSGTDIVRLALTLRERDYGRYRVIVRAIGGAEITRRGDLTPNLEAAAPTFTIDIPATDLPSGDYMLTLQGAASTGEFDDLSQSIIRFER